MPYYNDRKTFDIIWIDEEKVVRKQFDSIRVGDFVFLESRGVGMGGSPDLAFKYPVIKVTDNHIIVNDRGDTQGELFPANHTRISRRTGMSIEDFIIFWQPGDGREII